MTWQNLHLTILCGLLAATSAWAGGKEDNSTCRDDTSSPTCERLGSCAIQGSAWYQHVTIDKREKFDTQGWPGLCDMVPVALVQGHCDPAGSDVEVLAALSDTTVAYIPNISGGLACGGDGGDSGTDGGGVEGKGRTCSDGLDNDGDATIDCGDPDCFGKRFCR
jgi:hypothetical protein